MAIKRATSGHLRSLWLSVSSLQSGELSLYSKALAQAASERTFMLIPSVTSDLRNLDFPFMSAISPRPKPSTSLRSELSLTTSSAAPPPAAVAADVCDRRTVFESEWGHYQNQASDVKFSPQERQPNGVLPPQNGTSCRFFKTKTCTSQPTTKAATRR